MIAAAAEQTPDRCTGSLRRTGVVVAASGGTERMIAFDAVRCPGCSGGCGVAIGAPRLAVPESVRLPVGTSIVVTASLRTLGRSAARVFAPTIMAVAGAAAAAQFGAWSDWHLGAVVLGTAAATVVLARKHR